MAEVPKSVDFFKTPYESDQIRQFTIKNSDAGQYLIYKIRTNSSSISINAPIGVVSPSDSVKIDVQVPAGGVQMDKNRLPKIQVFTALVDEETAKTVEEAIETKAAGRSTMVSDHVGKKNAKIIQLNFTQEPPKRRSKSPIRALFSRHNAEAETKEEDAPEVETPSVSATSSQKVVPTKDDLEDRNKDPIIRVKERLRLAPSDKRQTTSLVLHNPSDNFILVKIYTNQRGSYIIFPVCSIVSPHEEYSITVRTTAGRVPKPQDCFQIHEKIISDYERAAHWISESRRDSEASVRKVSELIYQFLSPFKSLMRFQQLYVDVSQDITDTIDESDEESKEGEEEIQVEEPENDDSTKLVHERIDSLESRFDEEMTAELGVGIGEDAPAAQQENINLDDYVPKNEYEAKLAAIAELQTVFENTKTEIQGKEAEVTTLTQKITELNDHITELEKQVEEDKSEKETLMMNISSLEAEKDELVETANKATELEERIAELRAMNDKVVESITTAKQSLEEKTAEVTKLNSQIIEKETLLATTLGEKGSLEQELETKSKDLDEKNTICTDLKTRVLDLETKLEEAEKEVEETKLSHSTIEANTLHEQMEDKDQELTVLKEKLTAMEKELESVIHERDDTQDKVSKLEARLSEISGEKNMQVEELEEIQNKLMDSENEKEKLQTQLDTIIGEKDMQCETLKEAKEKLKTIQDNLDEKQKLIEELEAREPETVEVTAPVDEELLAKVADLEVQLEKARADKEKTELLSCKIATAAQEELTLLKEKLQSMKDEVQTLKQQQVVAESETQAEPEPVKEVEEEKKEETQEEKEEEEEEKETEAEKLMERSVIMRISNIHQTIPLCHWRNIVGGLAPAVEMRLAIAILMLVFIFAIIIF